MDENKRFRIGQLVNCYGWSICYVLEVKKKKLILIEWVFVGRKNYDHRKFEEYKYMAKPTGVRFTKEQVKKLEH